MKLIPFKQAGETTTKQVVDSLGRMTVHGRTRSTSSGSGESEEERREEDRKKDVVDYNQLQNTEQLPGEFLVKYLGKKDARGLWGIKHTRKPVDDMVSLARGLQAGTPLPYLKLTVSDKGVNISPHSRNLNTEYECGLYPIDTISYGVQDLVYTRVFAMIVVKDTPEIREGGVRRHPFECHAFVCESRQSARKLTFALASAFQVFSKSIKSSQKRRGNSFAIDLRSPEELQKEFKTQDSEA
ncbi:uncharacterized protein LOC111705509 [Eurytemora carolleeae]|uniref:uncharacterized protein LOC111705509 n=1 Tax=Eurytemora carolleeae TaxID=1294199 RepID=UPI000C763C07|nr:uncharacterized protein LOC111705509 [Eurytemora carolleeae]|eukprot:XP_023333854.1 uncharacterized protein LOC111705509 [Eurytemora affinis]